MGSCGTLSGTLSSALGDLTVQFLNTWLACPGFLTFLEGAGPCIIMLIMLTMMLTMLIIMLSVLIGMLIMFTIKLVVMRLRTMCLIVPCV